MQFCSALLNRKSRQGGIYNFCVQSELGNSTILIAFDINNYTFQFSQHSNQEKTQLNAKSNTIDYNLYFIIFVHFFESSHFCNNMIRLLSISRNGSHLISVADFFLSISTGMLLIFYCNYYVPLINSPDNKFSIYSILYSLLLNAMIKAIFDGLVALSSKKKIRKQNPNRQISLRNLPYLTVIKLTCCLSIILLLVTLSKITFTLSMSLLVIFVFSLQFVNSHNQLSKMFTKGRNTGSNKIKNTIIFMLVLTSLYLQPLTYDFSFQLHFQFFIIITTSLMIFSYYFLIKQLSTLAHKNQIPKLLYQIGGFQCIFIICLIAYYDFFQNYGVTLQQQLIYISQNILILLAIIFLNFIYQYVLIEVLKKMTLQRLIINQVTGLLWLNIYTMAKGGIEIRLYVSVIIMFFILLINMEVFSDDNIKRLLNILSGSKKKKKKIVISQMEMKQSQNDK